jgi:hypothetical protein
MAIVGFGTRDIVESGIARLAIGSFGCRASKSRRRYQADLEGFLGRKHSRPRFFFWIAA